jgi:hypothetical protein
MLNPIEEFAQMEERKRDLLRSARMHELYRKADEEQAQVGERLMTLIGDLMISGGQKLKARSGVRYTVEAQHL